MSPRRRRDPRAALLLAAMLASSACAHTVHLVSDPPGATVRQDKLILGPTPRDVTMVWWPWRKMEVHVQAPGYRAVDVSLRREVGPLRLLRDLVTGHWKRLVGKAPRAEINVMLVREHEGVGTWSPDDIKR